MFSPPPTSGAGRMAGNGIEGALGQRRESSSMPTGSSGSGGFTSPTQFQPQFPLRGKMSAMQIRLVLAAYCHKIVAFFRLFTLNNHSACNGSLAVYAGRKSQRYGTFTIMCYL